MAVAAAEQLEQIWALEDSVFEQSLGILAGGLLEADQLQWLGESLAIGNASYAVQPEIVDAETWTAPSYQELPQDATMPLSGYPRPAESETYGRSLSTIRRLGAFMIGKATADVIHSPAAAQTRVEFYTSVQEGFGTDMELGGGLEVRDFDVRPVIDGKVFAKDLKTAVSDMTTAGLLCAEVTAQRDKHFLPQLTRSKWDHENALIVDEMARGETDYNTRIVVSPFPEEAAAQSGDAYWQRIGYVPHLKRGFVQLYHVNSEVALTGSLSFDGSRKVRLKEVFGKREVQIPETEITDNWLKYAITANLSVEEAKELALEIADEAGDTKYEKNTNTVDITGEHRKVMETVFNESYIHVCESLARGLQTPQVRTLVLEFADKAQHFNERYTKALYNMKAYEERFSDDDSIILHELLVYSTIEMMRALHLDSANNTDTKTGVYKSEDVDFKYLQNQSAVAFQHTLSSFAVQGAKNNRTYSACGLSISLGGSDNINDGPQDVFGGVDKNKTSEEVDLEDCEFVSEECPECGEKNVKTIVKRLANGKKNISGSCGCSKTV